MKPANDVATATEDRSFWDTVRSQILDLVKQRPRGSEISQLLVFGALSHDPHLNEILSEAVGDWLTFEDLRQAGPYQRGSTSHGGSTLRASVRPNETEDNIDPTFAAARGATLYGLHSILEPCRQCRSTLACDKRRVWETFLEGPLES